MSNAMHEEYALYLRAKASGLMLGKHEDAELYALLPDFGHAEVCRAFNRKWGKAV